MISQSDAQFLSQYLGDHAALGALLRELQVEAESRASRLIAVDLQSTEALKIQAEVKGQLYAIDRIKELIHDRAKPPTAG